MTTKQEYREQLKKLEDAEKQLRAFMKAAKKVNKVLFYELAKAAESTAISKSIWVNSRGFSMGRPLE